MFEGENLKCSYRLTDEEAVERNKESFLETYQSASGFVVTFELPRDPAPRVTNW